MADLVVDIGNTALKAAWSDSKVLGKTFRYQGEMIFDFILSLMAKEKPDTLVISSVINVSDREKHRLEKECGRLILMDGNHKDAYEKLMVPQFLTPDRAAAAVAARYLFKGKGCTIVDFGTMMTVDFLDGEGNYMGGNISPGCRTRFKSVKRYSKSLPLLDTPGSVDELGTSLTSSIESGIIKGIIFEIRGYSAMFPDNIIVFTGGDAIYFAKKMKNSIFVVCNLVLMGLALIPELC